MLLFVVGLACLVAAWVGLAPAAVGGKNSYIVTAGTSMLPHFRAHGLVVTRSADTYHVGQVAAYRNLQLHAVVMHRIVARHGARYVFQGDNNAAPDDYQPSHREIVGREWVYWQGGGRLLAFVRAPATFAVIMAALGMFAADAYMPRRSRRRRRHAH